MQWSHMVVGFLNSDKKRDVAGTYCGTYTWQAEDRSVKVQVLILLFYSFTSWTPMLILVASLVIPWQNLIFPFHGFEGALGIVEGHCYFCYSKRFCLSSKGTFVRVWVHWIAKYMCEGLESRRGKDSSWWPEPTATSSFCWPFYFKLISCTANLQTLMR